MTVVALTRSGSGFGGNETGPAAALQPVTALVRLQIATSACLLLPFVAKRHLLPGFHVKNGSFFRIDHIKNDRCCALGLTARAWRFLQIHRPVGATGEHSTRRADRLATPCRNPRRESVVDPQRDIDERCCRAARSTHRWRRRSEACNGQGLGPRSGRVPLNAAKAGSNVDREHERTQPIRRGAPDGRGQEHIIHGTRESGRSRCYHRGRTVSRAVGRSTGEGAGGRHRQRGVEEREHSTSRTGLR